jgi:hypothetical protein
MPNQKYMRLQSVSLMIVSLADKSSAVGRDPCSVIRRGGPASPWRHRQILHAAAVLHANNLRIEIH